MRQTRRAILVAAGAVLLLRPARVPAQEPGRIYRIAFFGPIASRTGPGNHAMLEELAKLGFVEGKNLVVEPWGVGAPLDRFPALAAELAKSGVDAIESNSDPVVFKAAQSATRTIPIFGLADDMVGSGFVASLAHPGGNTTGISILAGELDGKRQDILMELLPTARHMAALADPAISSPEHLRSLRDGSRMRGIELSIEIVRHGEESEIEAAIDRARASGAVALNVLGSGFLNRNRHAILKRTAALQLPAIYQWPETAQEGGLIAYGPSLTSLYRQLARQVAKLLRGVRPADLPVEQPTTFELVINLKTAKVLGLAIPPSLLARADEVIE